MTTTTKYKTYPKYKPSGVDWLGDIPDGWEVKRLRYFFNYHMGGVWGDEEKGDQNDLICLRVADFDFDHFGLSGSDLTTRNIPENQHSRILEKGDILLEKSGGGEKQTVGRAVRFDSSDRAVCSNFIEKLTPLKAYNSNYISYLMGALYFGTINVRSIKQTTGIQNLDIYAYFSEVVPFPEKTIQKSIADFLDREMAKIDEMVAKKQKMIELLKEKRQALITHAVTKGIYPKAKMKPSGIDWLGEIPEGWEVKRLKFLFKVINGATPKSEKEEYWDGDIFWVTPDDLGQLTLFEIIDTARKITKEGYESCGTTIAPASSIILSTRAPIGHLGVATKDTCTNQGCRSLVFKMTEVDKKFFYYLFQIIKGELQSLGQGSTFSELSKTKLESVFLPTPVINDQYSIVIYLDRETAKIDEMTKKVETQIEKLQEYRQALITSAVTGKFKFN